MNKIFTMALCVSCIALFCNAAAQPQRILTQETVDNARRQFADYYGFEGRISNMKVSRHYTKIPDFDYFFTTRHPDFTQVVSEQTNEINAVYGQCGTMPDAQWLQKAHEILAQSSIPDPMTEYNKKEAQSEVSAVYLYGADIFGLDGCEPGATVAYLTSKGELVYIMKEVTLTVDDIAVPMPFLTFKYRGQALMIHKYGLARELLRARIKITEEALR